MDQPTKYILFCAQEANFQTRSMLIPYDLISQCEERMRDLQCLRDNAKKNVPVTRKGEEYLIDQLLIENIVWKGGFGKIEESAWSDILSQLKQYADGSCCEEWFSERYDEIWYPQTILHVASKGFDHVVNYCNFRKKEHYRGKPIEIVEGFLVLQEDK